MRLTRRHLLMAATSVPLLRSTATLADPGVSDAAIVFGQAASLDGPAAALGTGMRTGILAAFAEANRKGGVGGRKLELVTIDDGYEPTRSIDATRQLIDERKVFALIGPVGTPTAAATQPIAAKAGLPFIAPYTGAEFLRAAAMSNVINLRASYFQETEQMVERLTKDLGVSRIAILYQDDAYGRAGLDGAQAALARRNMTLVSEGTYERNTTAVKGAILAIRKGNPDAVIMIGAYKPCAEFIRQARRVRFDVPFVNISFVGSEALAKELGPDGAGVIVTQVVPFPFDGSNPAVARYQAALKAVDQAAEPGFVSMEGYLAGRLTAEALGRVPGIPTREGLMKAFLDGGPFDMDGFVVRLAPGRNQGSDRVFLTSLKADGTFQPLTALTRAAG